MKIMEGKLEGQLQVYWSSSQMGHKLAGAMSSMEAKNVDPSEAGK